MYLNFDKVVKKAEKEFDNVSSALSELAQIDHDADQLAARALNDLGWCHSYFQEVVGLASELDSQLSQQTEEAGRLASFLRDLMVPVRVKPEVVVDATEWLKSNSIEGAHIEVVPGEFLFENPDSAAMFKLMFGGR